MSEIASKDQLRLAFVRWAVVTVPFVLLLGFTAGRLVPVGSANPWYAALAKPGFALPDWGFPVGWVLVYALMGVALAVIINARGSQRAVALVLFGAQLAIGLAWAPLFFGAHRIDGALGVAALALVAALATCWLFGRIRKVAAGMMLPYLLWIAYAGLLTWSVGQLNPGAGALAPAASSSQIVR